MSGDVTLGAIKRLSFLEYSLKDGLAANAAGTQAAGTPIIATFSRFSTVAGAKYSALAPKAVAGRRFVVANDGANTLALFPYIGDNIDAGAANAAFYIPAGGLVEFYCFSDGTFKSDPASNYNLFPAAVKYNTNATTGSTVLLVGDISGGQETYLNLPGTLAGAANIQMPTVATWIASLPNPKPGQTYTLRIINSSAGAFAWTVTTNTGWTLNGTMTIAQNTWREFIVTITSLTAATLQAVGTGTQS